MRALLARALANALRGRAVAYQNLGQDDASLADLEQAQEFADAVRGLCTPEVDGLDGYRSQAICMAVFESSRLGRAVGMGEVERGEVEVYQGEIDRALGIG